MDQLVSDSLRPTFACKPPTKELQIDTQAQLGVHSTLELLDSVMQARETLFTAQLKQGLKPHHDLNKLILK